MLSSSFWWARAPVEHCALVRPYFQKSGYDTAPKTLWSYRTAWFFMKAHFITTFTVKLSLVNGGGTSPFCCCKVVTNSSSHFIGMLKIFAYSHTDINLETISFLTPLLLQLCNSFSCLRRVILHGLSKCKHRCLMLNFYIHYGAVTILTESQSVSQFSDSGQICQIT